MLSFLAAEAGLDAKAAYSTFNMGAGFALYCAAGAGGEVVEVARGLGLHAWSRAAWRRVRARWCWSRSGCASTATSWSCRRDRAARSKP